MLRLKITANIYRGPGIWIFNNSLLNDPSYIRAIEDLIDNTLQQGEIVFDSHKIFCDYLKQNISFTKEFASER